MGFDELHARYRSVCRAIALKLAGTNRDLVEDLVQEGFVVLWQLDLSKARSNLDSYVRQAIHFRLIDYMRKWSERYRVGFVGVESLDALTATGFQVHTEGERYH